MWHSSRLMIRQWRWVIAAVTMAMAAGLVAFEYDHPGFSVARVLLIAIVGVVMVGAGFAAIANGEDRVGALVVAAGSLWLIERVWSAVPSQLVYSLGALVAGLWVPLLFHAIVAFPTGRLTGTPVRALVAGFYLIQGGNQVAITLLLPSWESRGGNGPNEIVLFPDAALAQRISDLADIVTLGILIGFAIMLVHRAVAATPPARRAFGFVWVGGVVLCVNLIVLVSAGLGVVSFDDAYGLWLEIVAGVVPIAMILSLFASRVAEDRLVRLVVDLETGERGEQLLASLRRALADPTLDLVYSLPGGGGWIHGDGRPAHVESDHTGDGRVVTPVVYRGAPIAAIVHDPVLLRSPERLATAAAAAGLALDNERLQAELRAQVVDVQASRARIVEAGDRERRRVERNLHDGAQQRLVGVALTVRLAGRKAAGDPEVAELLAAAARDVEDALTELRELARGIHPAVVSDAGLVGALEMLAQRPGVPVELSIDLPERLPEPAEVAAYYVVSEALANANKHGQATRVLVEAAVADDVLHLVISDDGRGGATARPGSGLEGLADRVSALAGKLDINSPPGQGTTLTADLPLQRHQAGPSGEPGRDQPVTVK